MNLSASTRTFALSASVALTALAPRAAFADTTALPGDYVARPITLPKSTLRFDAGPKWPFPPFRTGHLTVTHVDGADDTFIHTNPGLTFGFSRDFELGVMQPIRLSPDADLLDPVPHLTYRFADGKAEAGLFVAVPIPFQGPFEIYTGIPIRLHLGRVLSFDLGPFLHIFLDDNAPGPDDDDERIDLVLPFELAIQLSNNLFLGPEATILVPEFDAVHVPGGFFLGYTITDASGTLGDLIGRTRFYTIDEGIDAWELMFSFELFFDL